MNEEQCVESERKEEKRDRFQKKRSSKKNKSSRVRLSSAAANNNKTFIVKLKRPVRERERHYDDQKAHKQYMSTMPDTCASERARKGCTLELSNVTYEASQCPNHNE